MFLKIGSINFGEGDGVNVVFVGDFKIDSVVGV